MPYKNGIYAENMMKATVRLDVNKLERCRTNAAKVHLLYSLFWGTYQVDVSQLQMVNCRIYLQLWICHYSTVNIRDETPDPIVAYPYELLSCLCPRDVKWRIAVGPWSIVDACCAVNHYLTRLPSDLLFELMCKQTLNTLIRIEGWFEVLNPRETHV